MKLTLLDTKTNKTKKIISTANAYWWAEGNGSCDCNRAIFFDGAWEELLQEHKKNNPKLYGKNKHGRTYCIGSTRILIIKIDSVEYIRRI